MVNWTDPSSKAVDGFTVSEIQRMTLDSVVTARCSKCDFDHSVEPDAEGYTCQHCQSKGTVTSPLVKLGLI